MRIQVDERASSRGEHGGRGTTVVKGTHGNVGVAKVGAAPIRAMKLGMKRERDRFVAPSLAA